jgi:hypothetical protein
MDFRPIHHFDRTTLVLTLFARLILILVNISKESMIFFSSMFFVFITARKGEEYNDDTQGSYRTE